MKPIKPTVDTGEYSTLPVTTDVYALCLGDIPSDTETVYISNESGHLVGKINVEIISYLIQCNNLTKMSSIMNHISEAAVAVDKQGRIFYANENYTDILDAPLGKIIGRDIRVIESEAALIEVIETQKAIVKEKTYIKTIDKYASVRMYPLFAKGEFQGAFSIFTDITQTKALTDKIQVISEEVQEYRNQLNAQNALSQLNIVGDDPNFTALVSRALVVAKTDATVLIRGENGTGKELVAKLIQSNSSRSDKPFITVNCAAIPENLIESELFGYEEGTFTGAKKGGRIGKFQLADGGTIFLDEIGDMPVSMQSKLLRVLQENEIEKIGKAQNIKIDVRVIAATNQPLEDMIEEKLFRRDLYYRLKVIELIIPPLRERLHDIVLLANNFVTQFCERYNKKLTLSLECYNVLGNYSWPGNIRELKSCIEHAVILCTRDEISLSDLPDSINAVSAFNLTKEKKGPFTSDLYIPEPDPLAPFQESIDEYEKYILMRTIEYTGGNKTKAMELLKLSRRTFYRKLNQYGLV
ncbi:MAG: sigma-54 interaction domain-containing protein [Lachnospiraceae bacterium]